MTTARFSISLDRFTYPDGTTALADISLEVAQGEFCGILGANGSGKTTLLRVMDGLARDYEGSVLLDDLTRSPVPTASGPVLVEVPAGRAAPGRSTESPSAAS